MANQTAHVQNQIAPSAYPSTASVPPYTLGGDTVILSRFQTPLQPAHFNANGASPPAAVQPTVSPPASVGGTKRKADDADQSSARKRKVKTFDVETSEVVSGEPRQVGARHWTDREKGRFFNWLLGKDECWDVFSTQMNTVFRDASAQLFDNRKTFTAIKSCYHRNVETFRQIYSLEKYLIHTTMPDLSGVPPPDYAPLPNPATFESSSDRLAFIDRRLEAARAVSVETGVGNVSAKVIEHWCRKGWYVLFKRRFKEEDEGQIVPYFGKDPSQSLLGKGLSHPAAILFPQPDPPDSGEQDEDEDADAEGSLPAAEETAEQESASPSREAQQDSNSGSASATPKYRPALIKSRPRKRTPAALASNTPRFRISNPQKAETSSASASQTQAQPSSPAAPAATSSSYNTPPVASYPGYPAHPYPPATAHMYPPPSPHFDYSQAYPPGAYAVPNPHVQQLTQLAMNLITSCTTLVDQLRERAEEGRELVELLRKREEREKAAEEEGGGKGSSAADRKEKVAVATQILADPNADEEIKQAAKDFLKRLFA